jgi:hypothetical protein
MIDDDSVHRKSRKGRRTSLALGQVHATRAGAGDARPLAAGRRTHTRGVRTVRGAGAHTRARLLAARGASGTRPLLRLQGPTPRTATHASLLPAQARPGSSTQAVKRAGQASGKRQRQRQRRRGASGRERETAAAGGTVLNKV